jgi:C4-dicarboxylate-specific signal transduction histidine kinase
MKILSKALIISFIALFIFGGALIAVKYSSQSISFSAKDDLLKAVAQQAREPARIFANSHSILRGLSADKSVINFLSSSGHPQNKETPTREVVEETLSHFNIENYPAIYLMDPSGLTVASTDKERAFLGKNYAMRDYFQKAIKGEPWTDMAVGVTTNLLGYYFSEPVKDNSGKIIGVAAAKLDNTIIEQAVVSGLLNSFNGNVMIVDTDGVIIYSQESKRLFKTLALFSDQKKQNVMTKNKFIISDFTTIHFDSVQRSIDNYANPVTIELTDPLNNKNKIVALTAIGKSPFYLMVEVDKTNRTLASLENFILILFCIMLAISLIVLSAYFLVRKKNAAKTDYASVAGKKETAIERADDESPEIYFKNLKKR